MFLLQPSTNWLAACSANLQTALQDMAQHLQIETFAIHHPDYHSLELSDQMLEQIRHLPQDIQDQLLNLQLQGFLYGTYYNGSMQATLAKTDSPSAKPLELLENNTLMGVDIDFYHQIHNSNCGIGYFDPGWLVLQQTSSGHIAVTKDGLTLHIHPEQHLESHEQAILQQNGSSELINRNVAIRLPANQVQNGFYVAVSNLGLPRVDTQPLVRIYLNLTATAAPEIMNELTDQLNHQTIPFSFKVLYNAAAYQRHDSGVLYFNRANYPVIQQVLDELYPAWRSRLKPEVPLFTKWLASGIGLAEEPLQKSFEQESFGMNRCQLVAKGLLNAHQQGDKSPEQRLQAIRAAFMQAGVDLCYPYLNPGSSDIYSLIA